VSDEHALQPPLAGEIARRLALVLAHDLVDPSADDVDVVHLHEPLALGDLRRTVAGAEHRREDALRGGPADDAVALQGEQLGEIGGTDEEDAAVYIKTMTKPVIGFISGRTAPPGKRMGHAGAIVSGNKGTAQAKVAALTATGVPVPDSTSEIPALVRQALARG